MKCKCGSRMYQQYDIEGVLYWVCPSCLHTEKVKQDEKAW